MKLYPYIIQPLTNAKKPTNHSAENNYLLGQYFESIGNHKLAQNFYRLAHKQNDVRATYKIAEYDLVYNPIKNAQNYLKIEQFLATCCKQNIVHAILNLIIFHLNNGLPHYVGNTMISYPINSLNGLKETIDKQHHNIIFYCLGVKHEIRGEIEMAKKYFSQSYAIGCHYALGKLLTHTTKFTKFNHIKKYYKQCECFNCNELKTCMPYGLKYCCEKCNEKLNKTHDMVFYECYDECYKMCIANDIKLNNSQTFLFKQVKMVSVKPEYLYANEIIYAGMRSNNALFAEMLKVECNTFLHHIKWRAYAQMLFYMARHYINSHNYDDATNIHELIHNKYKTFGKIAGNIGVCYSYRKMHAHAIKYYLIACDYNIQSFHNIIHEQLNLNDIKGAKQRISESIADNNPITISKYFRPYTYLTDDEIDKIVFRYLENGQITLLQNFKMYYKNDSYFLEILLRITNKHRIIKQEIEKLKDLLKCNCDCSICFEENKMLLPLKCGHYFCNDCITKMRKKCPYRCENP